MLVFGGERDSGVVDDLWSLKLTGGPLAGWLHRAGGGGGGGAGGGAGGEELCRWVGDGKGVDGAFSYLWRCSCGQVVVRWVVVVVVVVP